MAKKPDAQQNQGQPQTDTTQGSGKPQQMGKSNVIDLASRKCCEETCKKTSSRAGFCDEHFSWYKEGLITNEGHRPRDFDKKYQLFMVKMRKAS
jgi:hypothetical protein